MYSNGFLNMMIYMHTINTSLESNNENDDDVIVLLTCVLFFFAKIDSFLIKKQLIL